MNWSWEAAGFALTVLGLLCKIAWSAGSLVGEMRRMRKSVGYLIKRDRLVGRRLDEHENRIKTLEKPQDESCP